LQFGFWGRLVLRSLVIETQIKELTLLKSHLRASEVGNH